MPKPKRVKRKGVATVRMDTMEKKLERLELNTLLIEVAVQMKGLAARTEDAALIELARQWLMRITDMVGKK